MDVQLWIQILGGIVAFFSVIALLYKGTKAMRKDYRSIITKRNRFYCGDWHNEGDVLRTDKHYIDLKLTCHSNEASGYFSLRKADTQGEWLNMDISGKRIWFSYKCVITHVRFGRQSVYGKVKLKKQGSHLKWITLDDPSDIMPKEVTLFKTLPTLI